MLLYWNPSDLSHYIARQLDHLFPCGTYEGTHRELVRHLPVALERAEWCFAHIKIKYFRKDGAVFFSPLITDQYTAFLYFLANTVFLADQNQELADRLYCLNKALHGVDIYYQIKLPRIFYLAHSVGTVLGRAQYGEFLVVYQGVTVGGNLEYEYPIIGERVGLFSNCSVLGRSKLNDGVLIAARAVLVDQEVPSQHVCFGMHPHAVCKPTRRSVTDNCFNLQPATT